MFAEDLQGDIYNSSPGVSVLFLFSHSGAHTENIHSNPSEISHGHSGDCDIGLVILHKQKRLEESKRSLLAGKHILMQQTLCRSSSIAQREVGLKTKTKKKPGL